MVMIKSSVGVVVLRRGYVWSGIYRTSSTEKVALVRPAIKQHEQRREQEQVLQYGKDTTPYTTLTQKAVAEKITKQRRKYE